MQFEKTSGLGINWARAYPFFEVWVSGRLGPVKFASGQRLDTSLLTTIVVFVFKTSGYNVEFDTFWVQ